MYLDSISQMIFTMTKSYILFKVETEYLTVYFKLSRRWSC